MMPCEKLSMFVKHLLQNCKSKKKKKKSTPWQNNNPIHVSFRPTVRLPDVRLDDPDNNDTNQESASVGENEESHQKSEDSQPPPQFKIMRRSEGSSPSSRNSNAEDASKESRKNMTFEERKTAYEEARARIFQNLETGKQ